MNKRRHQTIADLAAVAICPALIVLLISSLVYFLIMCVYRGGYTGRIGYIWFMFILGAVAIARLSIQESRKYALGYAVVLGGATFFVLGRFMTVQGPMASLSPLINAGTIALIWYLADRITFDCTLIDEDKDASGRGLLDGLSNDGVDDQDTRQHASRKRGHQPGRTVLWLTAAALPFFGFGQMMLPQDASWQRAAMITLATYLFAALSLLVVTSFLGVRRYLRQRGVDMPTNVSTAWLSGGMVLIAAMLFASFLLPQPGKMLANAELPRSLESPDWLKPSKYGWGSEAAKPNASRPGEPTATTTTKTPNQPPSSIGDAGQPSGQGGGQQSGQQSGQGGGQKSSSGQNGQKSSGGQNGQKSSGGQASSDGPKSGGTQESRSNSDSSGSQNSSAGQKSSDGQPADKSNASPANQPASPDDASPPPSQSQPDSSTAKQDGSPETNSTSSPQAQQGDSETPPSSPPPDPSSSEPEAAQQPQPEGSQPESADAQSPAPPASPISSQLPSLTSLIRLVVYVVLIAILLAFAWIQRHEIVKVWNAWLAWLRGQQAPPAAASAAGSFVEPRARMPFAAFRNPLDGRSDPREAVIVTYQAAEAWWREHGQPRHADETPFEYSRRLQPRFPAERESLLRLTDAYNRVVYGNASVQPADLAAVAEVWKSFADT